MVDCCLVWFYCGCFGCLVDFGGCFVLALIRRFWCSCGLLFVFEFDCFGCVYCSCCLVFVPLVCFWFVCCLVCLAGLRFDVFVGLLVSVWLCDFAVAGKWFWFAVRISVWLFMGLLVGLAFGWFYC